MSPYRVLISWAHTHTAFVCGRVRSLSRFSRYIHSKMQIACLMNQQARRKRWEPRLTALFHLLYIRVFIILSPFFSFLSFFLSLVFVKKFPRRLPRMTHITVLPYQLRLSFYSSAAAASLYAVCGILHGREMRGGWGRAITLLFVFPFLSICKTQWKIDGNGSKSSCARLGNCRCCCCCCCPETICCAARFPLLY